MEISVRSYLTVGTAAIVGAGAIALTPALPSNSMHNAYLPAPSVAQVNLTGFGISLGDILGVLQNFGGGSLPDLSGFTPAAIPAIVVEFVKEASPVVLSTAGDLFTHVNGAVMGLIVGPNSIPVQFGSAIAAIPGVVQTAFGELTGGQIQAALQTLNAGLLAPVKSIGEVLLATANGIADYVSTQVSALATALPGILAAAIQKVTGADAQALIDTIKTALTGLFNKLSNIGFHGGWGEGSHHHGIVSGDEGGDNSEPADSESEEVTPVAAASVAAVAVPRASAPRAAAAQSSTPAGDNTPADSPKVSSVSVDAPSDSTDSAAPVRRGAAAHQASTSSQRGRQNVERPSAAASARAK